MAIERGEGIEYKQGGLLRLKVGDHTSSLSKMISRAAVVEIMNCGDSDAFVHIVDHFLGLNCQMNISYDLLNDLEPFECDEDLSSTILGKEGLPLDIADATGARALEVLGRHEVVHRFFNALRRLQTQDGSVIAVNHLIPVALQQGVMDLARTIDELHKQDGFKMLQLSGLAHVLKDMGFSEASDDRLGFSTGEGPNTLLHTMGNVGYPPLGKLVLGYHPQGLHMADRELNVRYPEVYPGEISVTLQGSRELELPDGSTLVQTSDSDPVIIPAGAVLKQKPQQEEWTGLYMRFA